MPALFPLQESPRWLEGRHSGFIPMASPRLFPILSGKTLDAAEFWRENPAGGWVTAIVLLLILAWKLFVSFSRRRVSTSQDLSSNLDTSPLLNPNPPSGISRIVTDTDLVELIKELDPKDEEREKWEDVIDKKNDFISYNAKCCRPKDGPLKYRSITIFEKCSTELLRDFYMDNEYRREWDKTLIEYKQLQVDETSGTEIGCLIKKFPLLTPREYVLAWRVWEGKDKTFYCVTKECEHSQAPLQKKYVRVGFFRSGWRIRKVPGRDACEITLVHQEDAGLNVEMARLAFARGIWSYVCKMNNALRAYSSQRRTQSSSVATMLRLIKKVPLTIENDTESSRELDPTDTSTSMTALGTQEPSSTSEGKLWKKPSKKKLIANGLLLLGGIACLSHARALGTQLAMACILKKIMHGPTSDSREARTSRSSRARHERDPRRRD